mmetsp:Transcript_75850/g.201526  ORF Transcript_75850/g.201526 Transcript_75850/m.201526 type:complete len:221 (-) Transcript_75850:178-840(-)
MLAAREHRLHPCHCMRTWHPLCRRASPLCRRATRLLKFRGRRSQGAYYGTRASQSARRRFITQPHRLLPLARSARSRPRNGSRVQTWRVSWARIRSNSAFTVFCIRSSIAFSRLWTSDETSFSNSAGSNAGSVPGECDSRLDPGTVFTASCSDAFLLASALRMEGVYPLSPNSIGSAIHLVTYRLHARWTIRAAHSPLPTSATWIKQPIVRRVSRCFLLC